MKPGIGNRESGIGRVQGEGGRPIADCRLPIPGFMIRVGPAGWTYPDSPGHIYPAGLAKSFVRGAGMRSNSRPNP